MEFHFEHMVRTITPPEAFTVVVTASIEREDTEAQLAYAIPLGISGEAMARLALDHYDILALAWLKWIEYYLPRILDERVGIAGERDAG